MLGNLERFAYRGDIHLVSRSNTEVNGRRCVGTVDELPEGIDVAALAVPRVAVLETLRGCARRKVRGAVVYASGFAEGGQAGMAEQREIASIAADNDIALLGPNCIGFNNFVDGLSLSFGPQKPRPVGDRPCVAIVAQSGGMTGNIRLACEAKGLPVSHTVSTGNEAVLGVVDFIDYLIDQAQTRVIAVFAEQIRNPQRFLAVAARAREVGKPIVLLHPGRSERAKAAAQSHTGSMTSNYEVMQVAVRRQAVISVDTLEELFDVVELLTRQPRAPTGGTAILTDSGAFKSLAADFCDSIQLDLPELSANTCQALKPLLPPFAHAGNPLDVTAQGLKDIGLYGTGAKALLADPAIGSVVISIMPGSPEMGLATGEATIPVLAAATKPVVYVLMGGDSAVAPELVTALRTNGIPFFRSPERALRAVAQVTAYGRALRAQHDVSSQQLSPIDVSVQGVLPEYLGKQLVAQGGLQTPAGALAYDVVDAEAIAARIGYPVVLKAQSSKLPHKTDAGGVELNIVDVAALRDAWSRMHAKLHTAHPELVLDGVLVESMAPRGLEMVVAVRRDADWGLVATVGLGGIWIEALKDVRLVSAELSEEQLIVELRRLKAARLLEGWRGAPGVDVRAIARAVVQLCNLLRAAPTLHEIEVNPLVAYPDRAAIALDVLAVAGA